MNIITCVKQIIDPEMPPTVFEIDSKEKRGIPPGRMSLTISDYDEVAVEAAVRIREIQGGKVTVLSLGDNSAVQTIKHCLAMGVDEGILLKDPIFNEDDRSITAYALAGAIKKIGDYDLILCGRQEGDWDGGQVWLGLSEILGIPGVGPAKKLEVKGNAVVVERIVDDGYEVIETSLPCVIAISTELATPRRPNVKEMMKSRRKRVPIWSADDINFEYLDPLYKGRGRIRLTELFIPIYERACEILPGDSPDEAGANLALKLKEIIPRLL